ncbi:hypothetical protein D9M69_466260 [compost metagenome]
MASTYAPRISSASKNKDASRSGQVLPSRIRRAMRHATTIYNAKARSTRSMCDSCSASTLQPVFRTWKNISTSHRARYQSTSSMTASASCASRFVNSRQTTGLTPAGAPISLASTQVSAGPSRPGSLIRFARSSCLTSRAFWPARPGKIKVISPSTGLASTLSHNLPPSARLRLCWLRISQSAGWPSSWARAINSAISPSRSVTYTSRVWGNSAACSATRSYPSIQRTLSLIPPRLPSASFGSRAHIQASITPSGSRSGVTA